jgi:hypothetical protein
MNCDFSEPVDLNPGIGDYQFSKMICSGGLNDLPTYNGFTSGEMVNSIFLFWIFSILLFSGIYIFLRGIKIKQ